MYWLCFLTSNSGHWECKDNSKWQQQQIWKIPGDIVWQEPPHNWCPHEDILVGKITCCISSTRRKKLSHLLSDVCCLWHPRAQRSQTWYVDLLVNVDWKSVISITIWKQLIFFLVKFHTTIIYYHVKLINKDKLEGGSQKVDGAKNRSWEQCKTMTTMWVATTRHNHTANHWNLKYFKHPVFNKIEDN